MTGLRTDATGSVSAREPTGDTVCIVGLGYVGLPLGLAFDAEGFDVIGYDVDVSKVETLQSGDDPTSEVGDDRVAESEVTFTADPMEIERAAYVVITVPTPVDETQNPNLDFVESAGRTVGRNMAEGVTVVLESTVYPGLTRNVLVPVLEAAANLTAGEEFSVGYSPERLSPGDEGRGLRDVRKIVSGDDAETLEDVAALYETVVDAGVYRAPNIETAEAAKVMENVQRDLNIALVNELSIICDNMDIDTHEVLDAAGTKWNFHDYEPGLVGGHCIPVDPHYLAYGSERAGYTPSLILEGRTVNEYMPRHAADLALRCLNQSRKVPRETSLLVLGLSYKPNVGDIRTSEVKGVIAELDQYDVDVVGYDPHADDEQVTEYFDIPTQDALSFEGFDGVILATPHDEFAALELETMADSLAEDPILVDVMGTFEEDAAVEAGLRYERL